MHPRDSELILAVADECAAAFPLLNMITTTYSRWRSALTWLYKEHLTGAKFVSWVKEEHENSPLFMMQHITKKLDHDKACRPLMAGRDIIL